MERSVYRSGPCGGTGTRTTGRPRCDSALAGGTCVVGEENSRGQVLCRGPWSCPARCVSPNGPGNKTPPTPAASTPRRQHQQHDDDTTRPIAAAALAPHLAIAMPQHHRHRQPSHPGSGRPLYGPSCQGMATSVKVVALDLSLALALPTRAV
ncbi:hypothetical protein M441DRAFT_68404 [Trichoderma asperellum CBS 433.97]|uniref:Uncharacterized protein n=1 Tax=Trichoderma asperellum (strain ATCC 204424 / CBS 433.97 / NBRC 101777) TaxID=1042311 RepID=A0A2T3Z9B5_TRIA4|nr:hypothetical protein M441DRAFT_68404 [Trichoderma asperellum CBS 433.97]PTB41372.1 hypothetical protein M441DRAFT_68404 [Trichoderma asperellum CBS 433.97]